MFPIYNTFVSKSARFGVLAQLRDEFASRYRAEERNGAKVFTGEKGINQKFITNLDTNCCIKDTNGDKFAFVFVVY